MDATPEIPGADSVIAWFGYWPSFHDAEVVEIHLNRSGRSWISLHAWDMTSEVDEKGYFVLDKHAVVTFELENVKDVDLAELSPRSVILDLFSEPIENGFRLNLDPCCGPAGSIIAEHVSVSIRPGKPGR